MYVMKIFAHSRDCNDVIVTKNDEVLFHEDGYVPEFVTSIGRGDDWNFSVDMETGQILNWDKNQILEFNRYMIENSQS